MQLTTVDGITSEEIICVASKKLSERDSKWTIYEIELFALVYCVKAWAHLLYGNKEFCRRSGPSEPSIYGSISISQDHSLALVLV